jgi:hypothetical protein
MGEGFVPTKFSPDADFAYHSEGSLGGFDQMGTNGYVENSFFSISNMPTVFKGLEGLEHNQFFNGFNRKDCDPLPSPPPQSVIPTSDYIMEGDMLDDSQIGANISTQNQFGYGGYRPISALNWNIDFGSPTISTEKSKSVQTNSSFPIHSPPILANSVNVLPTSSMCPSAAEKGLILSGAGKLEEPIDDYISEELIIPSKMKHIPPLNERIQFSDLNAISPLDQGGYLPLNRAINTFGLDSIPVDKLLSSHLHQLSHSFSTPPHNYFDSSPSQAGGGHPNPQGHHSGATNQNPNRNGPHFAFGSDKETPGYVSIEGAQMLQQVNNSNHFT